MSNRPEGEAFSVIEDANSQIQLRCGTREVVTATRDDSGNVTGLEAAGDVVLARSLLSMSLAPAYDVPTITYPISSGWGSLAIDATNSRFTYWGGANIGQNEFGKKQSLSTSEYLFTQPFFNEFGFDGSTLIIRAGVDSGKTKWYLWVDGLLAATSNTPYSAPGSATYDITIEWPTSRPRTITILKTWGEQMITPGSITNTIYKITRNKGRKLGIIGDSYGKSDGNALDGNAYKLALSLGYLDICPSLQGGTGYYATGAAGQGRRSFGGRFADEIASYGFDDIIVTGSINDLPIALPGVLRSDVLSAIRDFYSKVFSANSKARVHCFGCQYPDPTKTATYDALNAEIFSVISEFPAVNFYSTSGWLTGTGKSGSVANNGNRDIYRHSDGDHMTDIGYSYFAERQKLSINQNINF